MTPRALKVLDERRGQIRAVLSAAGVESAGVFGSVARGEAGEDSDLDLIVRFHPGIRRDLVGITASLENLTGLRVDVVDEQAVFEHVRRTGIGSTILAETIPL
jgi:predicted nucleotidyltransferase